MEENVLSQKTKGVVVSLMMLTSLMLMGFAPFSSDGFGQFELREGLGDLDSGSTQGGFVETGALFQTLSSRFGGGGVMIYMEYTAGGLDHSGMLLIDLRHAGLADLEESVLEVPDARRVELYYQEWDASGDLFRGASVSGQVRVKELFRGSKRSALALTFDLVFKDSGPDGEAGTRDDLWREVFGSATSVPTVEDAIRDEPNLYSRRQRGEYAPDGDTQVSCMGDVTVEEETYDETSYAYEDDANSCSGDTWEDDAESPEEGGGCAGKETLDEDEDQPDLEGGCDDGVGDDIDDPGSSEEGGSYYDGDYDEADTSSEGCDDVDSETGSDESDSSEEEDTTSEDEDESEDDDSSSCGGDEEESTGVGKLGKELRLELTSLGGREAIAATRRDRGRDRLRRRLDRLEAGHRSSISVMTITRSRIGRGTQRTIQRCLNYLPFVLLGFGIRRCRRRFSRI